jgi:hypothetical protein
VTGGFYTIASVTASVITLALPPGASLVAETGKSVTVTPIATTALVNFSAADTITRTDGGDFVADGFVAGMDIQVTGNTANATRGTAYYHVAGVSSTVLTLTSAIQVVDDANKTVTIAPVIQDARTPQTTLAVNFGAHTLTRVDGGSWVGDGFKPGMAITVAGSTHNNTASNQTYTITIVTDSVITVSDTLTVENNVPQATITGPKPPIAAAVINQANGITINATGCLQRWSGAGDAVRHFRRSHADANGRQLAERRLSGRHGHHGRRHRAQQHRGRPVLHDHRRYGHRADGQQ